MDSCCQTSPSAFRLYRPLIIVLGLSLAGGAAFALAGKTPAMDGAMGFFLLLLAAQQMGDLRGFAALFSGYDPLARRLPAYACAYSFLVAALGLAYLTGWQPVVANLVMLAIMTITTCGVAAALLAKRDLRCACAGAAYSLPVGRVTLAEYGIMAAMAAINLLMRFV